MSKTDLKGTFTQTKQNKSDRFYHSQYVIFTQSVLFSPGFEMYVCEVSTSVPTMEVNRCVFPVVVVITILKNNVNVCNVPFKNYFCPMHSRDSFNRNYFSTEEVYLIKTIIVLRIESGFVGQ